MPFPVVSPPRAQQPSTENMRGSLSPVRPNKLPFQLLVFTCVTQGEELQNRSVELLHSGDYMSAEDREAQEDELLALANIYTDDEFQIAMHIQGGQIKACLELPQGFRIFVSGDDAKNSLKGEFEVCFLPPVLLTFELPADYPSASAPVFVLSCKWLTTMQLSSLCKKLDSLWEENKGFVVLFTWMQFLKEETLQHLNITSQYEVTVSSDGICSLRDKVQQKEEPDTSECGAMAKCVFLDERAMEEAQSMDRLIRNILDFDQTQQLKSFQRKSYTCNVCFSERLGTECTQFKVCQHVYCKDCLRGYFEIRIKEGLVHMLSCPEPTCDSIATPSQVKELVGDELFSRYDSLLLQSSLNSMADVVYCPRLNCQTPVVKEPGGTMGICSNCRYAFCDLCKMTYHGVTPCAQPEEKEDADDESNTVFLPHTPFSHKQSKFKKWEEAISNQCIEENCKKCPQCKVNIEKNGGCHMMWCANCSLTFCWNCTLPTFRKNVFSEEEICTCRL
ncbi:E3 ubiquitin-protein ligase RNF14-like isoform X1 [Pleurodeles waltl]|uniref:E3 ubiquitin-protein ligase RNF14-like isoform X1 n=1 Tax=Pleurodeles waltl TaxID=8319 RepID=UPI0037094CAC